MFGDEDVARLHAVIERVVDASDALEDHELEHLPAGDTGLDTVIYAYDRSTLFETRSGVPVVAPEVAEFLCNAYDDLLWAVNLLTRARGTLDTIRHLVREG